MQDLIFETPRIYARLLSLDDESDFFDMQSNPNVMRYVDQRPMNREESLTNLKEVMGHYSDSTDGFRVWGAFLKESDEMIGTWAIISTENGHEVGYRLREIFWGNGYGTELATGVLGYAFSQLNIEKIFAEVDQRNTSSIKILDKTMIKIRAFWNEDSKTDDFYYEINKTDYEKIRH